MPQIKEGGGGGEIVVGEREGFVRLHDLMSNGEPDVPEGIEQGLDERACLLAIFASGIRHDQANVGVALQRYGTSPVAADGSERRRLPRLAEPRVRRRKHRGHQTIENLRVLPPERNAVCAWLLEHPPRFHPMACDGVTELASEWGRKGVRFLGSGGHRAASKPYHPREPRTQLFK